MFSMRVFAMAVKSLPIKALVYYMCEYQIPTAM